MIKPKISLKQILVDYPDINFKAGDTFIWSPGLQTITYKNSQFKNETGYWSLIHELSHYELGHKSYKSDFQLLQMEAAAWSRAKTIAARYDLEIEEDHIQDCLDTYRDWLHSRAKCPNCGVVTIQRKDLSYNCFNCSTSWRVPKSLLCRVSKKIIDKNNSP